MELTTLTAISPIDGRYRGKTAPLSDLVVSCHSIKDRYR